MDKPAPQEGQVNANKIHHCPWNSQTANFTTSRSAILLGRADSAFGSDQSFEITQTDVHPPLNPKKWHKSGTCLRVPKCVILSSLPYWVLFWKSSYFFGPRDIIGSLLSSSNGPFGNYYYFEQWNDHDPSALTTDSYGIDDPRYLDSTFWNQFDPPVSDSEKLIYTDAYQQMIDKLPPDGGSDSLGSAGSAPPSERFQRIIARARSVYYDYHNQLLAAFVEAKNILESDSRDPIYVTIPNLMNPQIFQKRNGYLKASRQNRSTNRGETCHTHDAVPCYGLASPVAWGPSYPNVNDPRNRLNITGPNVPWLASVDPGFGTNTLHMYIGHNCISYGGASDVFGYQAFPFSPEGMYIGPTFISLYLGAALPYFAGRRAVWRDLGYDIGFTGPGGAEAVYNWYSGMISAAAEKYKRNFWRFRNLGTRLFTYPGSIRVEWQLDKIWQDYKAECAATAFYFGFTFEEWVAMESNEDTSIHDCSGGDGLKYSEKTVKFPSAESLRQALAFFYPPIRKRADKYFAGIEPGTADVFRMAIKKNGLANYNVKYEGDGGLMLSAGSIVEYVRTYFQDNKAGK